MWNTIKKYLTYALIVAIIGAVWGIIAKILGVTSSILLYGISAVLGAIAGVLIGLWQERR